MRLSAKFPNFGELYDPRRMRELVQHLEALFYRVIVDTTRGAYTVSTNTTLGEDDDVVMSDTSGGDLTVTLPEISDSMVRNKREFEVVHIASVGATTVAATGSDTVMGAADALLAVQWTALRLRATPGNWIAV